MMDKERILIEAVKLAQREMLLDPYIQIRDTKGKEIKLFLLTEKYTSFLEKVFLELGMG